MVNGYFARTIDEALKIRAEHKVIPYAGGTDLMVENPPSPTYLFIGKVPELRGIRSDDSYIRIGAAVTFTEALRSDLTPQFMKEAVSRIAAPAIRNAGTFGGNLGNGSAKADSVLIEYAMDAKLRLLSLRGERILPVEEFYRGRKQTALAEDELIAEILLPKTGYQDYYYQKVGGRSALAISRVSFAAVFEKKEGKITKLNAAFGAVAPTVLRYRELEREMIGRSIEEAHGHCGEYLKAYSDRMQLTEGRVSAEYRKAVCMRILSDFLESHGI